MPHQPPSPARSAWRLTLLYATCAGLWIWGSDRLLLALPLDARQITWAQSVKGEVFVVATAALLGLWARRTLGELDARRELLSAVLAELPLVVAWRARLGGYLACSRRFAELVGLQSPEQVVGRGPRDLGWPQELAERVERDDQRVMDSGEAMLDREEEVPLPDGRRAIFLTRRVPLRRRGAVCGLLGVGMDITERKAAEAVLAENDRLKSEIVTTVAHEFRTPLAVISGAAQLLQLPGAISEAERAELLGHIEARAAELTRLVADLLDLSHIEAGRALPLLRCPCPVQALVADLRHYLRENRALEHTRVELAAPQSLLDIDRYRLLRALEALVDNALTYSPPRAALRLEGSPGPKGFYTLNLIDRGVGMTAEQRERAFERFYRADASTTAIGGLGLGLALVRQIVEAHGGAIELHGNPGGGTRAQLTLPLAAPTENRR